MKDLYAILGVTPKATREEIETARRDLAKILHPDKNPGNQAAANLVADINAAYDVLSDPQKRRQYDLSRKVTEMKPPSPVKADGSIDLLKLVPVGLQNAVNPALSRVLEQHGISANAATLEQVLGAVGLIPKTKKRRRNVRAS